MSNNKKYDEKLLVKLYKEGKSYKEIAKEVGCSVKYVGVLVCNLGISDRSVRKDKPNPNNTKAKIRKPKHKQTEEERIEEYQLNIVKLADKHRKEREIKEKDKMLLYSGNINQKDKNNRYKSYNKYGIPTFKNLEKDPNYFVDIFTRTVMDDDGNIYKVMSLDEIKQELIKDHGVRALK